MTEEKKPKQPKSGAGKKSTKKAVEHASESAAEHASEMRLKTQPITRLKTAGAVLGRQPPMGLLRRRIKTQTPTLSCWTTPITSCARKTGLSCAARSRSTWRISAPRPRTLTHGPGATIPRCRRWMRRSFRSSFRPITGSATWRASSARCSSRHSRTAKSSSWTTPALTPRRSGWPSTIPGCG